jgi:hypothetical protein
MNNINEIITKLKACISSREYQTGEVLIEATDYQSNFQSKEETFMNFIKYDIKINKLSNTDSLSQLLIPISKVDVSNIINEAFRIKPNYTCIFPEFTSEEMVYFQKLLFSMFKIQPKYYKINVSSLFQKNQTMDESSSCIHNGVFIIDDLNMGIFWINDFY